ncbi:MAG: glycoside hydrolase family 13 protein [Candidatus Aenigmatarchaeota archaeon]
MNKNAKNYIGIPNWIKDAIFYEIFPERFFNGDPNNDPPNVESWGGVPTRTNFFGGDLQGIINKLDYLETLGINAIYLTPIFAANANHKYDTIDYYKIDPHFGDINTFRLLLKEAHNRGIRIILDAVFNHVGENFWAFQDVIKHGKNSKYFNWFYIKGFPITKTPKPNYETYENAYYLVKLNTNNPEVRQYLYNIAKYWTSEGIDGWRLDVPYLISHDFWKDFRRIVKEINPELYIVGECWEEATEWLYGDEWDGAMNYPLRNLIIDFFINRKLDALTFDQKLADLRKACPGETIYAMLNLLGSHDTPRFLTLCKGNKELFKVAVAFLFTYVGIPMIYYGDEIGMLGENDPDCRRCMIWDSTLQDRELLEWHRKLIAIRKMHLALRYGSFQTIYASDDIYSFERKYNEDFAIIILNRGTNSKSIELPDKFWYGRYKLRDEISEKVYEKSSLIEVGSYSVLILTS